MKLLYIKISLEMLPKSDNLKHDMCWVTVYCSRKYNSGHSIKLYNMSYKRRIRETKLPLKTSVLYLPAVCTMSHNRKVTNMLIDHVFYQVNLGIG